MIYLGLIATILCVIHVVLTIKWARKNGLKDPDQTSRLMWLAVAIVFLQVLSAAWPINILLWAGAAIIDGYLTARNRKRIETEREDGDQ